MDVGMVVGMEVVLDEPVVQAANEKGRGGSGVALAAAAGAAVPAKKPGRSAYAPAGVVDAEVIGCCCCSGVLGALEGVVDVEVTPADLSPELLAASNVEVESDADIGIDAFMKFTAPWPSAAADACVVAGMAPPTDVDLTHGSPAAAPGMLSILMPMLPADACPLLLSPKLPLPPAETLTAADRPELRSSKGFIGAANAALPDASALEIAGAMGGPRGN